MTCSSEKQFCVRAGETFHPTMRWGTGVYTAKNISAITQATPVVVTATGHGLPNGWPCAVVGAQGMVQMNATRYPPQGNDWKAGTVLSVDTIQLNGVSSALMSAYTSGGALVYDTPAALAGVTATLSIYDNPGHTGTPLVTLVSPTDITIDLTAMTITPLLQTAGLTWTTGYYRLDVADSGGVVTELLRGTITIT